MSQTPDLIGANGEVRELTAEDLASFRPATEVLPSTLRTKLRVWDRGKAPAPEPDEA